MVAVGMDWCRYDVQADPEFLFLRLSMCHRILR